MHTYRYDVRLNLQLTMFLTMIAMNLVVENMLPKIDYTTWMHVYTAA